MQLQTPSTILKFHLSIMVVILKYYISCDEINVENCGRVQVPMARIIGGDYARPGEFPWMVSLQAIEGNNFKHLCGGTIINEHWIITAAHCVFSRNKPWRYLVYAGLHKLTELNLRRVKRYKVSKMIVHEGFSYMIAENDIALVRTKTPIDIKGSWGYINAICLPTDEEDPEGWDTVTGWGRMLEGGYKSNVLQRVKIPIVPNDICNESYASLSFRSEDDDVIRNEYENEENKGEQEDYGNGEDIEENEIETETDEDIVKTYWGIQDTKICAGKINRGSCQSDSGGPLIQINETGVASLIGVVSYGVGCAAEGYPGVYTKVASYVKWIRRQISAP